MDLSITSLLRVMNDQPKQTSSVLGPCYLHFRDWLDQGIHHSLQHIGEMTSVHILQLYQAEKRTTVICLI